MNSYNIAIVPGDGIGKEIVPLAWDICSLCAETFGFTLHSQEYPWGAGHYKETGKFITEEGLTALSDFDAILFGAVGLPEVDDTLPAKLFTFRIRTHFEQYVNYRPAKLLPGIMSPLRDKGMDDIDFVVVRENTEGEFVQNGRILNPMDPSGLATETNIFTRKGIERIAHYSFQLAQKRRKHLTNVTKSNTLIYAVYMHLRAHGATKRPWTKFTYGYKRVGHLLSRSARPNDRRYLFQSFSFS